MASLQRQALDFGWDTLKDLAAIGQYPFVAEDNFLRGAGSFEGATHHLGEIEKIREPMGRGSYPLIEDAIMSVMSKVPEPMLEVLGDPRVEYGLNYIPAAGGAVTAGIRQALKRIPETHGAGTDPNFFDNKQRGAINMFDAAEITPQRMKRVSTRIPSPVAQRKQGIDAHATDALIVSASELSPEKYGQTVDLLRQHPAFGRLSDDPYDAFGEMKEVMGGNLKWMMDIMPEKWRTNAEDWYIGYNRIAQQAARDHGTSPEQAAAAIAVMSPNTDWNMNLTRADRVMDTYNLHQNTPWTPEMTDVANDFESKVSGRFKDASKTIVGKKLSELDTAAEKAMWIRAYDMAHNPREFHTYEPTGAQGPVSTKKDGSPKMANWVYNTHAEKAIKILEDGSMENISKQLGGEHKVRSFFRNAADPWDLDTATVDTHAVAGDLLLPMGSSTNTPWTMSYNDLVSQNFGKGMSDASTGMRGTYPLHNEVFRSVGEDLGIPARQVQSPTWDYGRLLFEGQKTRPKQEKARAIWQAVGDGEISAQNARDMIIEAFGAPVSPYR
jgi:hypothetical protein